MGRDRTPTPGWNRRRIVNVRAQEAATALRLLNRVPAALHLDWPDASPVAPGDVVFDRSVARLATWCGRHDVSRIAVTWTREPDCDHEASAALARAIAKLAGSLSILISSGVGRCPILVIGCAA
jgi:LmbE family N-acetylglucosaminyl deacetylase